MGCYSVSGRLLLQYELIASTMKVEIYIIAKSVLVLAFPTPSELPDASSSRVAKSILPSAGCIPAIISGGALPFTLVQLYLGYKGRLMALPYFG